MALMAKLAVSVIRFALALLIFPLFRQSSAASRILWISCGVISISSLMQGRSFLSRTV